MDTRVHRDTAISLPDLEAGFRLGRWRVEPGAGRLSTGWPRKTTRHLEPRAIQVLLLLASRAGQFVSRDEILDQVWSGRTVTDDNLTGAIHALRQALGDDPRNPEFIETRTNVGYRLVARSGPRQPVRRRYAAIAALSLMTLLLLGTLLTSPSRVSLPPGPKTIAILPFVNLSESADEDYLAAAMTDAVILNLAQWPDLNVISRTSVMPWAERREPAATIAKSLGADLLVEGAILRSNGSVRVSAQLIDPWQEGHLWARQFDRDFDDVLDLQQELSAAIAEQIGFRVSAAVPGQIAGLPPESLQRYLQARFQLARQTSDDAKSALLDFRRLAALHPDFAPAHLGQAQARLALFKAGLIDLHGLEAAENAVQRFESLAGANFESHRCAGQIALFLHWDFDTAERRYQQAIAMNPSDTISRRRYAWLLVAKHQYGEAATQINRIRLLDPLYYQSAEMAALLLYAGQVTNAITEFERLDGSTELSASALRTMATAYLAAGDDLNARETLIRMLVASGANDTGERQRLMALNNTQLFRHILEVNPFRSPIVAAGFQNLFGNSEAALEQLEAAVASRDPYVLYLDALPEFATLRGHPAFQSLLADIGVIPDNQQLGKLP